MARGPSGNRLHGGLWELAHLAASGDSAAGGSPPAGKLLTALLGERLDSPLAARCAHAHGARLTTHDDVLADHSPVLCVDIIYCIIVLLQLLLIITRATRRRCAAF
jgi:hypothetical protein